MTDKYERPDGITDAEWRQFLDEVEKAEDALKRLICPDCQHPLVKKLDPRQVGGSSLKGTWFNYRCTNPAGCAFLVDQCEPD